MSNAPYGQIVERSPKLLHPKCSTPGWWARRKLHVKEDDVWECPICGIRYGFQSNGFGAIFWQPLYGDDTAKSLVVHHGYDPEEGLLAWGRNDAVHAELVRLRDRFWEAR